jgi:hypothetical protein
MNPRLYELMREAGYAAPPVAERALKLAELLIRDCAKIADIAEPYNAQDLILDYFGVENKNG